MFSSYITVPVYAAFYRWLGYGDEIDPMIAAWESGDRQAAAAAAPWELIEEMFIFGSPEEMKERIAAFVEGGITLPILTPITTPDKAGRADRGAGAGLALVRCSTSATRPASNTTPEALMPGHPERPERLRAIERALAAVDWLGWERREASAVGEGELELAHSAAHVAVIRDLCLDGRRSDRRRHSTPERPPSRRRCARPAAPARWPGP